MYGIEPLLKAILGKEKIEACGLSELQSLSRQYPYFAPLHLLLAEKIKTLDEGLYEQQLEKASLYVHKPLWLHYLLNKGKFDIEILEKKPEDVLDERATITEHPTDIHEEITPVVENKEILESVSEPDEILRQEIANTVQNEPGEEEEINNEVEILQESEEEKTTSLNEIELNETGIAADEILKQEIANTVQNEPPEENNLVNDEQTNIETAVDSIDASEELKVEKKEDHFSIPLVEEDEEYETVYKENGDLPPLHIPSLKIEPLKETGNDLLFEPYHTVDYFASQGIKEKLEGIPKDRFSHQLKSFTEWLKSMKKLTDDGIETQLDAGSEAKVQTLATHSIVEAEILTETMAEVWIKQGDWQKAAEVYHKLSLQNPSKSHYFAAKIKSLNTH